MIRRITKIVLPLLAFVPGCIVLLAVIGVIGNCLALKLSFIALLPALSLTVLFKSFGYQNCGVFIGILGGLAWSGLIAYGLHELTRLITAEDFAWSDFWGGLMLGFIPGAIVGWRFWIRAYESASLASCLLIGGLVGGIALGVYMGSCWSKARYE